MPHKSVAKSGMAAGLDATNPCFSSHCCVGTTYLVANVIFNGMYCAAIVIAQHTDMLHILHNLQGMQLLSWSALHQVQQGCHRPLRQLLLTCSTASRG